MTQIFPFNPPQNAAVQFQPVMDGDNYNAIITWNLFANRFYVNLYTTDNTLLFCVPVLESQQAMVIESVEWTHGYVNVTTSTPHGWFYLSTVDLLVSACVPDEYNGIVPAFITGPDTFQYPLAVNPGGIATLGIADFFIDISGGYFNNSTMVFRSNLAQFEVNP